MSLPTKTNLLTLDFQYKGEPFVNVPAKSSINLFTMDFQFRGEPFVSNLQVDVVTTTPRRRMIHH